jgi:nitrogen fixation/metabolism regulation signal transduction histidine kinase
MGFRLAKGVTGPIRALAEGTAEVARGNLDVSVQATSDDEIGFLVGSFNQMIRDLRDARSGIERSATELERRRATWRSCSARSARASSRSTPRADQHDQSRPRSAFLGIPAGSGLLGQKLADVVHRPELTQVIEELSGALRPACARASGARCRCRSTDDMATLFVTLHGDARRRPATRSAPWSCSTTTRSS